MEAFESSLDMARKQKDSLAESAIKKAMEEVHVKQAELGGGADEEEQEQEEEEGGESLSCVKCSHFVAYVIHFSSIQPLSRENDPALCDCFSSTCLSKSFLHFSWFESDLHSYCSNVVAILHKLRAWAFCFFAILLAWPCPHTFFQITLPPFKTLQQNPPSSPLSAIPIMICKAQVPRKRKWVDQNLPFLTCQTCSQQQRCLEKQLHMIWGYWHPLWSQW